MLVPHQNPSACEIIDLRSFLPIEFQRLLYAFFVIEHGRRRVVHFSATYHPTAAWVIQQLREAFSYDSEPKYFIFDRDSIFGAEDDLIEESFGNNDAAVISTKLSSRLLP